MRQPEKKLTVEGIAELISDSQKQTVRILDKRIKDSYESLARSVAVGFSGVDKRFDEADRRFDKIEADTQKFKEETEQNFVKVRSDMLNLDDRFVPRHEFERRIKFVDERISKIIDHPRR